MTRGHIRRERRTWRLIVPVRQPDGSKRIASVRLGSTDELPTKTAAREAADRWLRANLPGEMHAGRAMDWGAACDRYIATALAMQGTRTRATQTSIVDTHLRPAFSGPLHGITPAKVQQFVYDQTTAGVAPATVKARFSVLRRMLKHAAADGLAVVPPSVPGVTLPKMEPVQAAVRAKAFTDAECWRILAAAPLRDRTAYALARFAGLRVSELLGLTWSLIDLRTGAIEVRQQAIDGQLVVLKSKSSKATLQAPPQLLELLVEYRSVWHPNAGQFLFATTDDKPEDAPALRERLYALLEELGLPRRGVHGFRHACALGMADSSVNPEAIRRGMRHSSLRTTAIYLSAAPEDIAAALARGASLKGPAS